MISVLSLLLACSGPSPTEPTPEHSEVAKAALAYPSAAKGDTVDDFFGTKVPDPYRWLEDPDGAETKAWVDAQNTLSRGWIDAVPHREAIKKRLGEVWNYERWSLPFEEGGRYFVSKNDGLQAQSVLYWMPALDGEMKVLLDPNTLSADGTVALTLVSVSHDGKKLAYGTSDGGSDWITIRIRDVETGQDGPDEVKWAKFTGAAWKADGSGFYYSRYPEPKDPLEAVNLNQQVWFHPVGKAQSDDVLAYERPDLPEMMFEAKVSEDGRYTVLICSEGTGEVTRLYYREGDSGEFVKLLDAFDANYLFIGNEGSTFYVMTNNGAPRHRIVAIDLNKPAPESWRVVVPEADQTLSGAQLIGGKLVLEYLKDAVSVAKVVNLDGTPVRDVTFPGLGTAEGFEGDADQAETFFSFESFLQAPTIYRYDVATGEVSEFRAPKVNFDASAYETRQVFVTSKDGTKVPMFLTHKKGLKNDGTNPTLLYGYGGFNIPVTPAFSASRVAWLEMGGVWASANLRGGNEYGETWHQGGIKLNKQNVFDDFIASAEWLIAEKVTSPEKLAIHGRSNGGLLAGAVALQRPELFAAAIPGVGVLDMLRYHKFTIGWAWADDYGTAEDSAEQFKALYAYSPVHNVKAGANYPAILITTADHDDRVVPAHSFKFAAALQATNPEAVNSERPALIRIETRAGHGAGKSTQMLIEEWADVWAFLNRALKMESGGQKEG